MICELSILLNKKFPYIVELRIKSIKIKIIIMWRKLNLIFKLENTTKLK